MREPHIAFYVHHQGSGHLHRSEAIASHMEGPVTIFSSRVDDCCKNGVNYRSLPLDFDEGVVAEAFGHLHYAPLRCAGLRVRAAMLARWFETQWPCVLVVDVSVEVAAFARLCGVPVIYVRQRGERTDSAHEYAYATASRLLAPYPESWEAPEVATWWKQKTDYSGLISRYGNKPNLRKPLPDQVRKTVTVLVGFGGTHFSGSTLLSAAEACPDWQWTVVGPIEPPSTASGANNLAFIGCVEDASDLLSRSDVVVGSAGDGVVSELAHLRSRFVCIPEERPFDEQRATATLLASTGQAVVCDSIPMAGDWNSILHRALKLTPENWMDADHGGAALAAAQIQRAARQALRVSLAGVV
jgi:predicted glycosyltransferase